MTKFEINKIKASLEQGYSANQFDGCYSMQWSGEGLDKKRVVLAKYYRMLDDGDQNWEELFISAEVPRKLVENYLEKILGDGNAEIQHEGTINYFYEERRSEGGGEKIDEEYKGVVKLTISGTFPYRVRDIKLKIDFNEAKFLEGRRKDGVR